MRISYNISLFYFCRIFSSCKTFFAVTRIEKLEVCKVQIESEFAILLMCSRFMDQLVLSLCLKHMFAAAAYGKTRDDLSDSSILTINKLFICKFVRSARVIRLNQEIIEDRSRKNVKTPYFAYFYEDNSDRSMKFVAVPHR